LTLAELARKPSYVVLNAIPPRRGIGREAAEGLTAQGARVAPAMLSQRAAFAHGVVDGPTAQEFEPDGKAAEEVEALYAWLCGIVGMSTIEMFIACVRSIFAPSPTGRDLRDGYVRYARWLMAGLTF
jgi:NAD(P)-dependent dehydrogenase (short-subunit alcohol dehydrogenase family)